MFCSDAAGMSAVFGGGRKLSAGKEQRARPAQASPAWSSFFDGEGDNEPVDDLFAHRVLKSPAAFL
jgi:hypothetical protein